MMRRLRMKAVVHESRPEGALVYRKPSRRCADARRDLRRCGESRASTWCGRLPPRPGFRSCVTCVPAVSPRRRGRWQTARRISSASRWMRITALTKPSPARSATISASTPETVRATTCLDRTQASGADRDGFNRRSTTFRPRVSKPASRFSSPASASVTPAKAARPFPASGSAFTSRSIDIPARIGKVAYGVCCNSDDSGNFDYIAGVEVSDFSDLPRAFTGIRIPAQRYAVFSHCDHISSIRRTVNTVVESLAAGVRAASHRRTQLRALRRQLRSAHRQWRPRNLDTRERITAGWVEPFAKPISVVVAIAGYRFAPPILRSR